MLQTKCGEMLSANNVARPAGERATTRTAKTQTHSPVWTVMGPPAILIAGYCAWSVSQMWGKKESSPAPANVFPLYVPACSRVALG